MEYRIGIDAGSKTVKLVVMDRQNKLVFWSYQRHGANIHDTLKDLLHSAQWRAQDFSGSICITGSAGIEIARALDLPFVQEVVATTRAAQQLVPQADAIIELGGEDAKVVYLTGGLEQRMNATCAGGTGGFIDTMAYMLGVRPKDMSSLAMGANRRYPIASRCAVFAQTDVRPLLNAGVRKADIAGSVFDAVVGQTLGGLACGRPIQGNVLFLGGPLEFNSELVSRFRTALGLTRQQTLKPANAHLFTAMGAALTSADRKDPTMISLSQLETALDQPHRFEREIAHLPRLFNDDEDYRTFKQRHDACGIERVRFYDVEGPVYVGIDAGSTTMKLAVLDQQDRLCYSDYRPVSGDVLACARDMLEQMYRSFPHAYGNHDPYYFVHVAHATVTGYGEDMLRTAFGIDSGIVETTAHLRAAKLVCPDLTFLLDIGGQDIKALWVRDGAVTNAVLNEACSSGCGSFLSGMAHSLRSTPEGFSHLAVHAEHPLDLGMKCTVFMTSRVRHAQKIGADRADIAAGLAYSVVYNALYKIIGMSDVSTMGDRIMVQGGTFLSDAVLRAFELTAGKQVLRPSTSELSGAIGAALAAHERAEEGARSLLIGPDDLQRFVHRQTSDRCPGCQNKCPISIISFGLKDENPLFGRWDGMSGPRRLFISGNRCNRAYEFFEESMQPDVAASKPPNLYRLEQRLLARYGRSTAELDGDNGRAETVVEPATADAATAGTRMRVGLPQTMHLYESTPFWYTLLDRLGFDARVTAHDRQQSGTADGRSNSRMRGLETVFSESVCYPAKITHLQIADLLAAGVDAVFMPHFDRGTRCPVSSLYGQAIGDSLQEFVQGRTAFSSPQLQCIRPAAIVASDGDRTVLFESLTRLASDAGCDNAPVFDRAAFDNALAEANAEQERFYAMLAAGTRRALSWIDEHEAQGIVLAGRPYHVDARVCHGVDGMLCDLGYAVLSPAGINALAPSERAAADALRKATPRSDWKPAKTLLKMGAFAAANPRLNLVALYSFGCGYDAITLDEVRGFMESHDRLFTALKVDEIVDLAHVRIRLRTLDEMIEQQNRKQSEHTGSQAKAKQQASDICTFDAVGADNRVDSLDAIAHADLTCAREYVTDDVCLVVSALAGALVNRTCTDDPPAALRIPQVCSECMVDAVPLLAQRVQHRLPEVDWSQHWEGEVPEPNEEGGTRIGVLGNALFSFDVNMNRDIATYLRRHGCTPVFPESDALFADDVSYTDQIAAFAKAGVNHVIYLQAFGCLKGHVQTRGAQRKLQRQFPRLHLTVIDYDANASLLNQENRILLAIDAAKRS